MELIRLQNEQAYLQTGKKQSAYVKTYGCQQNVSDGERLQGMLDRMGFALSDSPEQAQLVLFNTCAIRENAENRVFGNIGALRKNRRKNPSQTVAVCGCMVQQPHVVKKIKQSYPYVDLVFGTHNLPSFPELLHRSWMEKNRVFVLEDTAGEIVEDLPVRRDGVIKAWLPVMYGCNNFCTYCVVPLVRGRERSREPAHILAEARQLIADGYREITLLGQNVNSYGKTLEPRISFPHLLQRICEEIPGKYRIRFMTSHPKDCTREMIDVIAAYPQVCNHIHLPVQSGSDRILAAMNRRYTAKQYLDLIEYARKKIPGVSFTSDIIVGFPGETAEDFQKTLQLVEEVSYHSLYTFLYSQRQGTKAAEMQDATPHAEKMERFNALLDLQRDITQQKHQELVGKTLEVLADGMGRGGEGQLSGRTDTGVIVDFDAPAHCLGNFVQVEVMEATQSAVSGRASGTFTHAC